MAQPTVFAYPVRALEINGDVHYFFAERTFEELYEVLKRRRGGFAGPFTTF